MEGAIVALFDRNSTLLRTTIDHFVEKGLKAKGYVIDVADEDQVKNGVNQVEAAFGRIDVMVHCAGIVGPTSTKITDYPTDEYDKILAVNLKGSFLMTKYTIRKMEKANYGMTAKIPMSRLGEVEEVAAMASIIVSKENSFSTGFIFDISGGRATY